jgi:hypothetical protein
VGWSHDDNPLVAWAAPGPNRGVSRRTPDPSSRPPWNQVLLRSVSFGKGGVDIHVVVELAAI